MKLINLERVLVIAALSAAIASCNCGDDAPADVNTTFLQGKWSYDQQVVNNAIDYNVNSGCTDDYIIFADDHTYTITKFTGCEETIVDNGQWLLQDKTLQLSPGNSHDKMLKIVVLQNDKLIVHGQYDANYDGIDDMVRHYFYR